MSAQALYEVMGLRAYEVEVTWMSDCGSYMCRWRCLGRSSRVGLAGARRCIVRGLSGGSGRGHRSG